MGNYGKKFNMFKLILDKDDPTIIEIGAHYGEDSMRFIETFPRAKVYCFEPDPRNINIFKKHITDQRIKLFEVALSNKNGHSNFYQSYQEHTSKDVPDKYSWIKSDDYINKKLNASGASSLKKGYTHALKTPIKVKTERFDRWYHDNNIDKVDFVWLDTQGAEREVIEGMGTTIKNIKYIWMEYGEDLYEGAMNREETLLFMGQRGFKEVKAHSDRGYRGDVLCLNTH